MYKLDQVKKQHISETLHLLAMFDNTTYTKFIFIPSEIVIIRFLASDLGLPVCLDIEVLIVKGKVGLSRPLKAGLSAQTNTA